MPCGTCRPAGLQYCGCFIHTPNLYRPARTGNKAKIYSNGIWKSQLSVQTNCPSEHFVQLESNIKTFKHSKKHQLLQQTPKEQLAAANTKKR